MDQVVAQPPSSQFPFKFKILLGILGFLILLLVGFNFALEHWGRFWEKKLALTPTPTPVPQTSPEPPASIEQFITTYFGCPVSGDLCQSGKTIEFNGHPALLYNLAPKSDVRTIAPAIDLRPVSSKEANGIRYTVIKNDFCYTVSYILGENAELVKFDELPRPKSEVVARTGEAMLTVNGEQGNLVIQLQKGAIEGDAGLPIFHRCGLLEPTRDGKSYVERGAFGVFEQITPEIFVIE